MKLIIASNNAHKIVEIKAILGDFFEEVLSLREAGIDHDTVEDGTTFMENAIKKAREIAQISGCCALADDSGICVDALNGAPGIYSARFSGGHGNDEANNDLLLEKLDGVPMEQRTAYYVCAICCVFPDGREITVRGECHGHIGFERDGSEGFGYDPLFIINGRAFGRYNAEEKDKISHRGNALRNFVEELPIYLKMSDGYCEREKGKDCAKCFRQYKYEKCDSFVSNKKGFEGSLSDIKGTKLRKQWHSVNTFIKIFLFCVMLIAWLKSAPTLFFTVALLTFILSTITTLLWGKTVAVVNDEGVYTNQVSLKWNEICSVEYFPFKYMKRRKSELEHTVIACEKDVYEITHMPLLFLKSVKKYRPYATVKVNEEIVKYYGTLALILIGGFIAVFLIALI